LVGVKVLEGGKELVFGAGGISRRGTEDCGTVDRKHRESLSTLLGRNSFPNPFRGMKRKEADVWGGKGSEKTSCWSKALENRSNSLRTGLKLNKGGMRQRKAGGLCSERRRLPMGSFAKGDSREEEGDDSVVIKE